ncbi:MAG: hypothetical protein U1D55_12045 [Phycisphaerae bacterium]
MRRIWLTLTIAAALSGFACTTPLFDLDQRQIDRGTLLGVTVLTPSASRTVPEGTVVNVDWAASNLGDEDATVSVFVESRTDLSRTVLAGGEFVDTGTATRSALWDTTGFAGGTYSIRAEIRTDSQQFEATAPGRITIDAKPEFEFAAPFTDATLPVDGGNDDVVTIRWSSSDREGKGNVKISVDPDSDHTNGNEIQIVQRNLPANAQVDSFDWNGNGPDNKRVTTGNYDLFAVVDDTVNKAFTVEGLARIKVPDVPTALTTKIVTPASDTTFLTSDPTLKIEFTFNQDADVLIDVKMDTDDNHANGNERTILQQRLIGKDTDRDSFDWNGTDTASVALPDGIYRPVLQVDTGSGVPTTSQADGLVFRRSASDQPLIALLEPPSAATLNAGSFLRIQWRDDDPSNSATVRIVYDDDPNPNEATETNAAEVTILSGRSAKDDGVSDSYSFQIPAAITPGTYYIFAYIDRDNAAPYDCISIAPGRFVIPNPNN